MAEQVTLGTPFAGAEAFVGFEFLQGGHRVFRVSGVQYDTEDRALGRTLRYFLGADPHVEARYECFLFDFRSGPIAELSSVRPGPREYRFSRLAVQAHLERLGEFVYFACKEGLAGAIEDGKFTVVEKKEKKKRHGGCFGWL